MIAAALVLSSALAAGLGPAGGSNSARNTPAPVLASAACSPGPYCGGGHDNLTDPWVPYPAITALAPDGLPFGAVGARGPQGAVGPASFAAGTATIRGVSPCATAGCTTTIGSPTYWGNESIGLLGNVTIAAGESLTVDDSTLTFTEPAAADGYAYGFNVTAGTGGALTFERGSNVTQGSPGTTRSWFLDANLTAERVLVANSTLNVASGSAPASPFERGIWVNWFNRSAFNGYGHYGTNSSLNATVGGAAHSRIANGTFVGIDLGNDTFSAADVGIVSPGLEYHTGSVSLNYTLIEAMKPPEGLWIATAPGQGVPAWTGTLDSVGPGAAYVVRSVFRDLNLSEMGNLTWQDGHLQFGVNGYGGPAYAPYSRTNLWLVENTTLENVTTFGGGCGIFGSTYNGNPNPIGASPTVIVEHDSALNISANDTYRAGAFEDGLDFVSTGGASNASVRFNLVDGYTALPGGHSESHPLYVGGFNFNVSGNLLENISQTPAYRGTAFTLADQASQVYDVIDGRNATGTHLFADNFASNWNGSAWVVQIIGNNDTVRNNTAVDLNGAMAFGVSANSNATDPLVEYNSCYGGYNGSLCDGSTQGGDVGGVYLGNAAYDFDTASYASLVFHSIETVLDQSVPSLYVENEYASPYGATCGAGCYARPNLISTTAILEDSTVQAFAAGQLVPGSTTVQEAVNATALNLQVDSSYVPPSLTALAWSFSSRPAFLQVSGFLGVFVGQSYKLDPAWSASGPLDLGLGGRVIAALPSGSAGLLYTFEALSGGSYAITAATPQAGVVPLTFWGLLPGDAYTVTQADANGSTVATFSMIASSSGEVSLTYAPATMGTDPVFSVGCSSNPCGGPGGGGFALGTFFGLPVELWVVLAVLVAAIAAGAELGRRHR